MAEYVSALRIEPAHRAAVTSVALTRLPDRSVVIASAGDDVIRLWDADTGDALEPLRGHRGPVRCLAFHSLPDRVLLASGGMDRTVRLWDVETATRGEALPSGGPVWSVAIGALPDGRTLLAAGVEDGPVLLWDVNGDRSVSEKLVKHTRKVTALTFGHLTDGSPFLVSGSDDNTIRLWLLGTGATRDLMGHTGQVTSLAFHVLPDGRPVLVSGSTDGTVRRWNPDDGEQIDDVLAAGGDQVWSVALGSDLNGRVLLAGGSDSAVRLWDVATGSPVGDPFGDHHQPILAVGFSPRADGVLVTGGQDGTVRRWEYAVGTQLSDSLFGHASPVRSITAIASTADDAVSFASCGDDGAVRVWEVREGEYLDTSLIGHGAAARALACFTDSDNHLWFVSGGDDGTVLVRDAAGNRHRDVSPIGHGSAVLAIECVVLSPHGPILVATGHEDGGVRVWTVGGDPLPALEGHTKAVRSLAIAFRDDGSLVLATGSADGTVRLWDPLVGGEATTQFNGQTSVWSVALMTLPDNRMLLASGGDNSIRIWELGHTPGPLPQRLNGHSLPVRSVTFATDSDGRALLVSGSEDGTVRLWDPINRTRLGESLKGHDGPVLTVSAVRPLKGPLRVLSGGEDGAVHVWEPVGFSGGSTSPTPGRTNAEQPAQSRTNAFVARDDTAAEDLLGRLILADHLVAVLEDLAMDRRAKDNSRGSAVIHVDGRWGAGKTTLVTLFLRQLRAGSKPSDKGRRRNPLADAIVVDYDAWRESAVAPEWWSLATTLNRAVRGARAGVTRAVMSVLGTTTRVMSSRPVLVATALLVAVAIARLLGIWRQMSEVSGVVTALTAVAAVGLSVGRMLFWTSPAFGKLYVKSDENPLGNIAKIVDRLRRWTPRQGRAHRVADTLAGLGGFVTLIVTARLMFQSETSRSSAATVKDWVLDRWMLLVLVLLAIVIVSTSWRRRFDTDITSGGDVDPTSSEQSDQRRPLTDKATQTMSERGWLGVLAKVAAATVSSALVWAAWEAPLPAWVLAHSVTSAVLLALVVVVAHAGWTWSGVTRSRRPVILVIDDLDRCTADRAVKLLETIHTLLRPRTPARVLRRWRVPAPLVVLVLADGRWIRVAFESAYPTFGALGSDVHGLGADFLQKLFDHTVLVPTMAGQQIKTLVDELTGAKEEPPPHSSEHAKKDAFQLIERRDPGELRTRDTNAKLFREPLARKDAIEVERRRVEKEASPTAMALRLDHLLTTYSSLMPPNPRLIKRVANTWSMLLAVQSHLNVGRWRTAPPDDLLVRAAIMFVRFPTLVDELLSCATLPSTDGTRGSGTTGSPWHRPDVQELLTTSRGVRIPLEEIAQCYGRTFPEKKGRHSRE